MSTIFSKIIDREIPADIVFEDDLVLAFLDINPINKGHTLIIPKKAFENIFDGDEETFTHMTEAAMKLGNHIKKALNADGINLIMNNGEAAGQEVFHAHIHVIPRFKDDQVFTPANHTKYTGGEAAQIATQITAAIS